MESYLQSTIKLFRYYKEQADKTMAQLEELELFWQYNPQSNSIATIVRHMAGNMLSRFTDFLVSDGEKDWRDRDAEFSAAPGSRTGLLEYWEKGWTVLLETLSALEQDDLEKVVYIRNEGHTVIEAVNRQLAHYASHVGQILYIGKMVKGENWQYLSIPPNQSAQFNQEKFSQDKTRKHFTDKA